MLATVHSRYRRAVADDMGFDALLADLEAEEAALDDDVAGLDDAGWRTPTPAVGFDVRDSIAHLAIAEELATLALTDAVAFGERLEALAADVGATERTIVERGRAKTGREVLGWWRDTRAVTIDALRARDARDRIPWIAGPMSAMSFATARLMETWAHGTDVRDGLGIETVATPRLHHIADLGVRTRAFSYLVRGMSMPEHDVRVELDGPDGAHWTWGTSNDSVVRGPALDFCRVVTQRGNPADTGLEVDGDAAREWMTIAQAFAGAPTEQRPPRS
jgi:uncharacterized protein (TIGR03084 family)